ncbi:alpha/beta hydrolase family esterase [Jongsikchunia kroppenstedtii]|uniref:alpha/beta hydrolase family esterase n=1 Tax=Jongsikchunia kroppenstedtii TaxID=1121721 RepID=UPI000366F992|nr:PHB depolymerase family esterase [Jongsikchunia kroppenstedtii]
MNRAAIPLLAGATTISAGYLAAYGLTASYPPPPDLHGRWSKGSRTIDGRTRRTQWYRPPTTAPAASAILLVLHGSGQNGAQIRRATGHRFDQLADEHGFSVIYPDGFRHNWNECRRQSAFAAKRLHVDDIAFIRALVEDIDPARTLRVLATGYSSGGQMATRLALEAPDLVTAIAPVAANPPTVDNIGCADRGVAVPAFFVAGTDDPKNPYGGGHDRLYGFADRGPVRSAVDGAAWFAERNGMPGDPEVTTLETAPDESGRLYRWSGRHPVGLLSITGGGHHYPALGYRGPRILGRTVAVDVPGIVTDFLLAQGKTE